MAFTLLACSDIRAQKVNLELPFTCRPRSLEVLQRIIELTFREEEVAIKRELRATDTRRCEPFTLTRLQRYDDDRHTWSDIAMAQDLIPYDQLYVYRKNSTRADISTQRELPPPRLSPYFARIRDEVENAESTATIHTSAMAQANNNNNKKSKSNYNSESHKREYYASEKNAATPVQANINEGMYNNTNNNNINNNKSDIRNRSSSNSKKGINVIHSQRDLISTSPSKRTTSPTSRSAATYYFSHDATTPEQTSFLFQFADIAHVGHITFSHFANLFKLSDVHFPSDVLQDVFNHFATNFTSSDVRVMSSADFGNYAIHFPITVSVLYQHLANQERISVLQDAQQETMRSIATLTKQVDELKVQLYNSERELERAESRRQRVTEELSELMREQSTANLGNEQAVLDKEISVFRYRERLAQEEEDYERMATEHRRKLHTNSPSAIRTHVLHHDENNIDLGKYGPPPSSSTPTSSLY